LIPSTLSFLDPVFKGTYGNNFDFLLIKPDFQLVERGIFFLTSATSGNRRSTVSTSAIISPFPRL
jgi:hypothetical protein